MFTELIRKALRLIAAGLAGTVAAIMFGPTLAANAATLLRAPHLPKPVQKVVAIKPLPEKQYEPENFALPKQIREIAEANIDATPVPVTSPVATATPTHSVTVITPKATPSASATPADSAPIPSQVPSPTAVATASPSSTPKPKPKPTPTATHTSKPKPLRSVKVVAVLAYARAQLGERYVLGGMGNGWDCSGLTKAAFSSIGIYIGTHSSNNQYETARDKGYLVPWSQRSPGDLVFYGVPGDIYHVAIYSGNNHIIEAANESEPVEERFYWGTPYSYVARFIR